MKVDTYSCDICGVQKKETNHWWLGQSAFDASVKEVRTREWEENRAMWAGQVHLCGIECACKFLARELAK